MKNKPFLYVFHFLGNSDLYIRKDVLEEILLDLNETGDKIDKLKEINKEFVIIDARIFNFRKIIEKISNNLEKYKDFIEFRIVKNEEKALNNLFPNHTIKFIFIYTNQKNDDEEDKHSKKDTLFLFEIIKKLKLFNIEEPIELNKVEEYLLFEKIKNYIKNIEKNKKCKTDYVIFSSAGIPIIKPVSVSLLMLNSIYRSSTILRCEIDDKNRVKILNLDIFELLSKAVMERNLIEFLKFAYTYLPLIMKIKDLKIKNFHSENIDKISCLVEYLYKRLIALYLGNKNELDKLKEKLNKFDLINEDDYLLNGEFEKNLAILLSKIQDFDLYVNLGVVKEAILLSTTILDLLTDVLINYYKIKNKIKLEKSINYKIYKRIGEKECKKEFIDTEKNSFFSVIPYLYESQDNTFKKIKELILGDDKIIKVKKFENEIIFGDLIVYLRSQRNNLAHQGYFEGNVDNLLKKLNEIYKKLFETLINRKFSQTLEKYKDKLEELIKKKHPIIIDLNQIE